MANHKVLADMGEFDVGMVDVIFKVVKDGSVLGRLKVSQGGVEWQEGRAVKRVYRMNWTKLQSLFLNGGRPKNKPLLHGPLRKRRT